MPIQTVNSRAITCHRCEALFQVVYPSDRNIEKKPLELNYQQFVFVKLIRLATNCDLRNAKGTFMYYVRTGKCHWCGSKIKIAEFVDRPKCKSLNICSLAVNK